MADDTVTDDPAKASQEALRRKILEELARRQQQQPQTATQSPPSIAGFGLSEEAREKQKKKREEEAARQQQQQREFDDIFLKTLAKIYGLPPQASSFKPEFVPILMASAVQAMPSPDVMVGKFAGAQELPLIQVAKDHVITQGGQMTPELAMQLAMLAASNPDMAREGVEIKGATEEDKLMLYAAAQLLGLKVLNPPQIDNEQKQAQRIESCKLGWQNLNQWAQPGQAPAPIPQAGPGAESDDEEQSAQPTPRPRNDVPPVIPVPVPTPGAPGDTGKKPPPGNAADAENVSDYDKLGDEDKAALRELFRALSQGKFTDEQIDQQLAPVWAKQTEEQRQAVLKQAHQLQKLQKAQAEPETAPPELTLTPPDAPVLPAAPTLKPARQRKFNELLPAEKHLLQEHGKKNGIKRDDVAKNWNRMREPGREKRYAEAAAGDETTAARAEEQRQAELRKLNKRYEADVEKIKQDHEAELKLFKAALLAANPATLTDSPLIRPVESRKFAELLPLEQELLRAHAVQKGENPATVSRKWNALSEEGRQKRFEDASNGNKEMAYDVARQQKDAVKILADALARAKANAPESASRKPDPLTAEKNDEPAAPKRTWEELDEADREEIREFVRREKSLKKAGDEYTEDEIKAPWGRMPDGKMQNEVLESIKKTNAEARAEAAKNKPAPANADADAPVIPETGEDQPDAENQSPPAGSPVVVKPDEKPRRSFRQIVSDLLSSVWKAITFWRTPTPAANATPVEPVVEEHSDALPADDNAGEPQVRPTQQTDAVVENKTENKDPVSAPTPVPTPAVVEKAAPPNLLRDIVERNWNELLDPEKEAAQIGLDNKDAGSEWDKMNAVDRNVAIQLGIDAQPLLAVKIDQARDAENQRIADATTPPSSNIPRVKQQDAIIATTPPSSNVARVAQQNNVAAVVEQEVPKDDPAFESALKAKGLTRDALLAMPPDQRIGILAEIKKEQEQAKAPVVEARRDEPPAAPAEPPVAMTTAFNKFSVDKIRELPPSDDARRVIQNQSLPKSIDKDKLLQAYQQIRAEVVKQQVACPGFRVSQAFLGEAARKNHTEELLGHKGLRPEEAHAILDALREEGLTTGKKDTHRNVSYAANDWQTKLASHYKPEM